MSTSDVIWAEAWTHFIQPFAQRIRQIRLTAWNSIEAQGKIDMAKVAYWNAAQSWVQRVLELNPELTWLPHAIKVELDRLAM